MNIKYYMKYIYIYISTLIDNNQHYNITIVYL